MDSHNFDLNIQKSIFLGLFAKFFIFNINLDGKTMKLSLEHVLHEKHEGKNVFFSKHLCDFSDLTIFL